MNTINPELKEYISSPVTWGKALAAFVIISALLALAFTPMIDKVLTDQYTPAEQITTEMGE